MHNERFTRRVMLGTMAGGENLGPGRPEQNWTQCLVDDFRVFRAIERSTENVPFVLGVETVQWPTAAKKGGKSYRGVVERGMFHDEVAQGQGAEQLATSRNRGCQESGQGNGDEGGRGSRVTGTAVVECRNEMVDRVARYRSD